MTFYTIILINLTYYLIYIDDVLTQDAGECVICLEDLSSGKYF